MRLTFDKLDNTPDAVTVFLTHLLPNPYNKVNTFST